MSHHRNRSRKHRKKDPQQKPWRDSQTWKNTPDEILLASHNPQHRVWPVAPSLRVGPDVVHAAAAGSPEAAAIADSYQFRFPVTVVSA